MNLVASMDGTRHKKWKVIKKEKGAECVVSVGQDLPMIETDWITRTDGDENKRRRTLLMQRDDSQSWGFTLQSYGIQQQDSMEVELLTYVDYVEVSSPAYMAGLRPGDVILSINGMSMEETDHDDLVQFIKHCGNSMRMVVLFEDCCRKVELHGRYLKLKRVLAEKIFELRSLEEQEARLSSGLSRFDSRRSSRASSSSSLYNGFADRSQSPTLYDNVPVSESEKLSEDMKLKMAQLEALKHLDLSPPHGACHSPEPPGINRFNFDRSSMISNISAATFAGMPSVWDEESLHIMAALPLSARLKPQLRQSTYGQPSKQRKLLSSRSYAGRHNLSGQDILSGNPRPMSASSLEDRRRHKSADKQWEVPDIVISKKSFGSSPESLNKSDSLEMDLFRITVEKNHNLKHDSGARPRLHSFHGHDRTRLRQSSGDDMKPYLDRLDTGRRDSHNRNRLEIHPIPPPRRQQSKSPNGSILSPKSVDFHIGGDHSPSSRQRPFHSSPYTNSFSSEDSSLHFSNPSYDLRIPALELESSCENDSSLELNFQEQEYDSDSSFQSNLDSQSSGYLDSNSSNGCFPGFILPRFHLEFINEKDEITKL